MGYAFEISANIIEAMLVTQFFVRYFGIKRPQNKAMVIIIMIFLYSTVMTGLNYIEYISVYQELIIDVLLFVVVTLFLNGIISEKLLMIQMTSVVSAVSSMLLTGLFGKWIEFDESGYAQFGVSRIVLVVLAKIIYLLFTELLIRNQIKEKQYVKNKTYVKLNIVVFATLIAHLFLTDIIYINAVNETLRWEIYFVLMSLAVIDIIIYMLFLELTNNSIRLLKEQMKNAAYESEKKEIENIQEIHRQTMKIRHDMKNLLLLIRLKLKEGRVEEAEQYLEDELDVKLAKINLISTGNRMADAVINRRVEQARMRNISMQVMIECTLDKTDEMDIAILMSNLLDNAIEAAVLCDNPFVNMKITRKETYLHIMISNSCKSEPDKEAGKLLTTKKDKTLHGYGISNVKDIVERYNGFYNYELEKGKFTTDILLHM